MAVAGGRRALEQDRLRGAGRLADRAGDALALLRLDVAGGLVAAAVDVAGHGEHAEPAVEVGDVGRDRVPRGGGDDAVAAVAVGRVALDQVALAGRRQVGDLDAVTDVGAGRVEAHDVVERRRVEGDAGPGRADGEVGLDAVAAALGDGDAAAVAVQHVALDDGAGDEFEDDGVADRALDDVVDDAVARRSRRRRCRSRRSSTACCPRRGCRSTAAPRRRRRCHHRGCPRACCRRCRCCWPASRSMAAPDERLISLPSMRLALASSIQMASPVFDVNVLSRTSAPRVPAVEVDAGHVPGELVVADRVAAAVVVGVGQDDAGLLRSTRRGSALSTLSATPGLSCTPMPKPVIEPLVMVTPSWRGLSTPTPSPAPSTRWPLRSMVMFGAPTTRAMPGHSMMSLVSRTLLRDDLAAADAGVDRRGADRPAVAGRGRARRRRRPRTCAAPTARPV